DFNADESTTAAVVNNALEVETPKPEAPVVSVLPKVEVRAMSDAAKATAAKPAAPPAETIAPVVKPTPAPAPVKPAAAPAPAQPTAAAVNPAASAVEKAIHAVATLDTSEAEQELAGA